MDFRLPELGEGVYEAELVAWQVKPGDRVKRGQTLMEVLTDKATMEVPAPFAEVIESVHAEPGQVIKVGDKVLSYTGTSDKDGAARGDDGQHAEKINARANHREKAPVAQSPVLAVGHTVKTPQGINAAPSV